MLADQQTHVDTNNIGEKTLNDTEFLERVPKMALYAILAADTLPRCVQAQPAMLRQSSYRMAA